MSEAAEAYAALLHRAASKESTNADMFVTIARQDAIRDKTAGASHPSAFIASVAYMQKYYPSCMGDSSSPALVGRIMTAYADAWDACK